MRNFMLKNLWTSRVKATVNYQTYPTIHAQAAGIRPATCAQTSKYTQFVQVEALAVSTPKSIKFNLLFRPYTLYAQGL